MVLVVVEGPASLTTHAPGDVRFMFPLISATSVLINAFDKWFCVRDRCAGVVIRVMCQSNSVGVKGLSADAVLEVIRLCTPSPLAPSLPLLAPRWFVRVSWFPYVLCKSFCLACVIMLILLMLGTLPCCLMFTSWWWRWWRARLGAARLPCWAYHVVIYSRIFVPTQPFILDASWVSLIFQRTKTLPGHAPFLQSPPTPTPTTSLSKNWSSGCFVSDRLLVIF